MSPKKPKKTDPRVAMAILMGGLENARDAGIEFNIGHVVNFGIDNTPTEGNTVPAIVFTDAGKIHLCGECGNLSAGSKCGYAECHASTWKGERK